MTDVLTLLNMGYEAGKADFYIPCPCCEHKPKGKHLNINLAKDVFRCPRCGFQGGMADFYAYYMGCSVEEAWERIKSGVSDCLPETDSVPKADKRWAEVLPRTSPLTGIEERDHTYRLLLEYLSLASDHRENLINRGLSDMDIAQLGYRTSPAVGGKTIARNLIENGAYLSGVPGFYKDRDGDWTFIHAKRGILIPMKDVHGRIQGLQLRLDHPIDGRKFRWIASGRYLDGCAAEAFTHLAGKPEEIVLLTEGGMKSDVIHALTGHTVLGMPGVNALMHTRSVLEYLRSHGMKKLMTAFDMDMLKNHHVMSAYTNLCQMIEELGIPYGTYLWDPRYKGLDDYLHAMNQL